MLWAVRHEWPSGLRYEFKRYCHWDTLMIRAGNDTGHLLHSKGGGDPGGSPGHDRICPGDPPLIQDLWTFHHGVTQPWYADNARSDGTFDGIRQHLDDLMVRGPPRGYYPEPFKSIWVVSPRNDPQAEAFFRGYGLKVVKCGRYLGGFMGAEAVQA